MATRSIQLPMGMCPVTDVEIVKRTESMSEYELGDGSVVRVLNPVGSIMRVEGQYDGMGNPLYFIQNQIVVFCIKSEEMYQKPKAGEKGS